MINWKSTAGQLLIAALAVAGIESVVLVMPSLTIASTEMVLLREAMLIGGSIALMMWLVRAGPVPAAVMGWKRPTLGTAGWGMLCLLATFAVSGAMIFSMKALGLHQNAAVLGVIANRPIWMIALICLTAAISEEIIYRGILLNYVASASGRVWVGAVVSLAAFALAHLSGWGWGHVMFAAVPGLVLTLFFLWKRDLGVCMIAHFLVDFLGLLGAVAQAHHG